MKWQIFDRDFDPQILEEDLKDPRSSPGLLKARPQRLVIRSGPYVIKAFRKKPFQTDPAWKEAYLGQRLAPWTAPVVAYGLSPKWTYVVTRWLEGKNLKDFFSSQFGNLSPSEKNSFSEKMASFLLSLQEKRVFQPDFHLENILVDKAYNFYLLDLHRAWPVRSYPERLFSRQLSYLLPPLLEFLSWWQIGRLLAPLARRWPPLRERKVRQKIQEEAYRLMRKHALRKEKKMASLFDLHFKTSLKERLVYRLGYQELALRLKDFSAGKIIKDSRTTKTFEITLYLKKPSKPEKYFLKVYTLRGKAHTSWRLLCGSRGFKTFWNSYRALLRGVPTIAPLVFHERRFSKSQARLLYPWYERAPKSWKDFLETLSPERFEALLDKLVRFLWEMHERGFFHGDAKITNFFLSNQGLIVFDLDRSFFSSSPLPLSLRLKDLATLAFSLAWLRPDKTHHLKERLLSFYLFLAPRYPRSKAEEIFERYFLHRQEKRKEKLRKAQDLSVKG